MSGGQLHVPMIIRMASGAGSQLSSQHSHSLEGWYAHIPGLRVVVPYTPYDARGLLKTAFRDPNPVIFLEHKALYRQRVFCARPETGPVDDRARGVDPPDAAG